MKSSRPTSIVLADDHSIVREGLRLLVESDPDFVVVGEATNGLEAIAQVKHHKPALLVLDLQMPQLDGLRTAAKVARLKPRTRVVVLTMYGDAAYLLEAMQAGAAGFVVKDSCGTDLLQAMHEVAAGRTWYSPKVAAALSLWHPSPLVPAQVPARARPTRRNSPAR